MSAVREVKGGDPVERRRFSKRDGAFTLMLRFEVTETGSRTTYIHPDLLAHKQAKGSDT